MLPPSSPPRARLAAVTALAVAVLTLALPSDPSAERYFVGGLGASDDNPGTRGEPWETLQHAADVVQPGDTVHVQPGSYAGFYLDTSGTADDPIDLCATCADDFISDYNVVIDRFSLGEQVMDLGAWQDETGQDAHSVVATPEEVFASFAGHDYRLGAGPGAWGPVSLAVGLALLASRRRSGTRRAPGRD